MWEHLKSEKFNLPSLIQKSEQKQHYRNLLKTKKLVKHCWFTSDRLGLRSVANQPNFLYEKKKKKPQEEFNGPKYDKPEPLRPVIHITQPFCWRSFCLSIFSTGHSCHFMFVEFPTVDKWLWFFPVSKTHVKNQVKIQTIQRRTRIQSINPNLNKYLNQDTFQERKRDQKSKTLNSVLFSPTKL